MQATARPCFRMKTLKLVIGPGIMAYCQFAHQLHTTTCRKAEALLIKNNEKNWDNLLGTSSIKHYHNRCSLLPRQPRTFSSTYHEVKKMHELMMLDLTLYLN